MTMTKISQPYRISGIKSNDYRRSFSSSSSSFLNTRSSLFLSFLFSLFSSSLFNSQQFFLFDNHKKRNFLNKKFNFSAACQKKNDVFTFRRSVTSVFLTIDETSFNRMRETNDTSICLQKKKISGARRFSPISFSSFFFLLHRSFIRIRSFDVIKRTFSSSCASGD